MAQNNELRLRIIKNGKPLYIIRLAPGKGAYFKRVGNDDCDFTPGDIHFIMADSCDSFELGIKVGKEWWFSGDIIENDSIGKAVIKFKDYAFFCIVGDEINGDYYYFGEIQRKKSKRIGSIHDEPEEG